MSDFYLRHEYTFAALQLIFAMLGMGAKLTLDDFVAEFRAPKSFLLGMMIQLLVVPLLAVAVGRGMNLTPGVATGLILLAAVPGGTASNIATYLARGNIALSIALTAVTTTACLITTPWILRTLAATSLPAGFSMPTEQIVLNIAFCLLTPLVLGMVIGTTLPKWRDILATRSIQISILIIVVMIIGASSAGRVDPTQQGVTAIIALLLLAALGQTTALVAARAGGLSSPDAVAIAIEVTIRNGNLAVMLATALFPPQPGVDNTFGDSVFFAAILYGGFAFVVAAPLVYLHRMRALSVAE